MEWASAFSASAGGWPMAFSNLMTSSSAKDRVIIFDTTLRDGEQSPGFSMNLEEKLQMAWALRDLGVDIIEAGFPIASPGDFEAVREVARQVEGPTIAGLCRSNPADIDRAWEALRDAPRKRIHVFLATSAIHREYKLQMAKEEIVRRSVESVERARGYCEDVEFSPEDGSRTEPDFLAEVCERAIEAGATTVNIPDTVGYAMPNEFVELIRYLKEHVSNIDKAVISVHCHNDLGLAVANSLAAVREGARQVECTINGIGERAGNCSLEEVVMAMRTRPDHYKQKTQIVTERLYPTSNLLARTTGNPVQRNKAIVGQNAFAHEAGIHQHGVLQNRLTYEIMKPEDVGFSKSNLVLGKHSGRHAFRERLSELGYQFEKDTLNRMFESFKKLADKKKEIHDADLEALIEGRVQDFTRSWDIEDLHVSTGTRTLTTATICLRHEEGGEIQEAACGIGPVEAVFNAIERATRTELLLKDYQIRGMTSGRDAEGEVSVEVEHEGRRLRSRAVSRDIIEASAHAFLKVINRIAVNAPQKKEVVAVAAGR
jgi:2-isopropylmalate synthase